MGCLSRVLPRWTAIGTFCADLFVLDGPVRTYILSFTFNMQVEVSGTSHETLLDVCSAFLLLYQTSGQWGAPPTLTVMLLFASQEVD